jgi:hypothetical protein
MEKGKYIKNNTASYAVSIPAVYSEASSAK